MRGLFRIRPSPGISTLNPRTTGFVVFALALSLGCARLGFWQISRLRERQARNALVTSRLEAAPVPLRQLLTDTARRFRRTSADGHYDYAHEVIFALRPHNGSPGVNLLTPLRLGGDTAVLVNRGWVYSPDGLTIDQARWREGDSVHVDGFADVFTHAEIATTTPRVPRTIRRLDLDSIQARIPYVLLPIILVQQTGRGSEAESGTPVRIDPPPLSEGSHRSYAIQWFGLALTGIVGAAFVATRDRKASAAREGTESPSAE